MGNRGRHPRPGSRNASDNAPEKVDAYRLARLMGKRTAAPVGNSKLAEAIRYALSRRAALERVLTEGRNESSDA